MSRLTSLRFDNAALRRLPLDPFLCTKEQVDAGGYTESRESVKRACFSLCRPTPVVEPAVVAVSDEVLGLLGLAPEEAGSADFAEHACGNKIIPGSQPAAHCYCGYQFGHFSGQLGDGAAMYLGEVLVGGSEEHRWEVQLKGAGKTPYSRGGDGRKVLRSSVREFLCSEAMAGLGVPTTRAAACVTSATRVVRDAFYTGDNKEERCTVVMRVAPTFLRFGSFEIFLPTDPETGRCGPSAGLQLEEVALEGGGGGGGFLPAMLDYTISSFFPDAWAAREGAVDPEEGRRACYAAFLGEVARGTARLCARWQAFGFCHGVLNTDNMSIVGLTIDYGPFGFLDTYDPGHVCNHSDDRGRYSYEKQPDVCKWNCVKLAEALEQVLPRGAGLEAVSCFDEEYRASRLRLFRRKLGLAAIVDAEERARKANAKGDREAEKQHRATAEALQDVAVGDEKLIDDLLLVMWNTGADFTITFRGLARINSYTDAKCCDRFLAWLLPTLAGPADMARQSAARMPAEQLQMLTEISKVSPGVLSRLGLSVDALLEETRRAQRRAEYVAMGEGEKRGRDVELWRPWLQRYWERLGKEVVDDAAAPGSEVERRKKAGQRMLHARAMCMASSNPHTILRNHVAQSAIERAEHGDYSEVRRVLELLRDPFSADTVISMAFEYDTQRSEGAHTRIILSWVSHKALPPNETLALELHGFERDAGAGDRGVRLELDGPSLNKFEAFWEGGRSCLKLVVQHKVERGESVSFSVTADNGICIPTSRVTWPNAREDPVPAEGGWYQLTIAEEYKELPPAWAKALCVSCSS